MMWKEPLLKAIAGVCIAATVVAFGMMYMAITESSRAIQ
jgi:hypothetical protein